MRKANRDSEQVQELTLRTSTKLKATRRREWKPLSLAKIQNVFGKLIACGAACNILTRAGFRVLRSFGEGHLLPTVIWKYAAFRYTRNVRARTSLLRVARYTAK